ncbi:nuclear transport factor 2 family protein [Homoserinimonas sp. A447]
MTDTTNRGTLTRWVEAYRRAWESNEPDDIRALFTEDAEYFTEPWEQPWRGHDDIVAQWLKARDEPGDTTFSWEVVAVDGDTGVIRAITPYTGRATYHNVWVIRFANDGRATSFTEWWMAQNPTSEDPAEN